MRTGKVKGLADSADFTKRGGLWKAPRNERAAPVAGRWSWTLGQVFGIDLKVRSARSRTYLETGEHSVGEVAALLGFADESAFAKAFKRWTGVAPSQYRRRRAQVGRPRPER